MSLRRYIQDKLTGFNVTFSDGASLDAFGRLKTASPQTLFDAQFTYDLQPLVYEQFLTNAATSTISHDTTNRRARIEFDGAGGNIGESVFMQSYEFFRYQPGKSQEVNITFNLGAAVSGIRKFAQYGDSTNALGFYQEGDGTLSFRILSGTSLGNQTANQSAWNLDKLDGTGVSKKTLNAATDNILYIDFQALYVGRVRFGFVIDGILYFAHEFDNANAFTSPYIQTANLPIRVGMTATSNAVTGAMFFNCCMVASNGGIDEAVGYEFTTPDVSVTAGSGTRTHLASVRPRTTFNSIENRSKLASLEIDLLVTGNSPVYWELCIGQAFSVAPTYANINTNNSAFEYGTVGTLSGSPLIVIDSGYVPATANTKGAISMKVTERYPITLNVSGAVRTNGTITLLVTGLGGSSACRAVLKHKEIR